MDDPSLSPSHSAEFVSGTSPSSRCVCDLWTRRQIWPGASSSYVQLFMQRGTRYTYEVTSRKQRRCTEYTMLRRTDYTVVQVETKKGR